MLHTLLPVNTHTHTHTHTRTHTHTCAHTHTHTHTHTQVIAQDRGKAKVTGDDLDIIQVNQDTTNFYPMQIDFQLVDLFGNN